MLETEVAGPILVESIGLGAVAVQRFEDRKSVLVGDRDGGDGGDCGVDWLAGDTRFGGIAGGCSIITSVSYSLRVRRRGIAERRRGTEKGIRKKKGKIKNNNNNNNNKTYGSPAAKLKNCTLPLCTLLGCRAGPSG